VTALHLPPDVEEAIEHSAEPGAARRLMASLGEGRPEELERVLTNPIGTAAVVAVAAASRSLARLCLGDAGALSVLLDLDRRPVPDRSSNEALSRWKRRELLRIAARDLTGVDRLEDVGDALSAMADEVLDGCVELGGDPDAPTLAVIGLGKLGGEELNYASDVDVVFVGSQGGADEDRRARRLMDLARRSFRVDADLRPEGRDGRLVRTIDGYSSYWERWAAAWEVQALIKARRAGGNRELGDRFVDAAGRRLWEHPLGAEELASIRAIKARGEAEVARRGLSRREVKRGWGGIRDIEMAVQLLQLVHGRSDDALRSRSTIPALAELGAAGYVAEKDAAELTDAYRFLRTVEHRLQLVEETQVHSVPSDDVARAHLARVMGYHDSRRATALEGFDRDLAAHQATVRAIHERLYFRPLLEAFTAFSPATGETTLTTRAGPAPPGGSRPVMGRSAAEARLRAFGFRDAGSTRAALRELTRGLTRTSRLMHQMLPLLLGWLSEGPNPDLGLLGLRTLASSPHSRDRMVETFRESPEAARRLCVVLSTSRVLVDMVRADPGLMSELADDARLGRRSRDELIERLELTLDANRPGSRPGALRLVTEAERFRIVARDLLQMDDVATTAAQLTDLAEAVVESALASLESPVPIAVVAMGRFGGAELSYASDLDVLLVFDQPSHAPAAESAAEDLLRLLNGATPTERIFTVDPGLRPEGAQGPLSRSLDSYRRYYERWAETWERQALVKARPVAGDPELGKRFMALVERFVWSRPLDEAGQREIRRMKARVERLRIPPGEDPQFHLKLGEGSLSDVEWTAQLLQLRSGVRTPGTLAALEALDRDGVIAPSDAAVLGAAYRYCEQTRNRLFLVRGAPGDALPSQSAELSRLARSLDTTPAALREEYRRVTRRSRQVVERCFYGMEAG
jgi:[glutamine synthetase] adenylyltransferase / [glutamine synthetase]-adenylyl-L-tyrosine phosphorylase